ncbi:hypothetical protein D3C76_1733800 [compost metagenome]
MQIQYLITVTGIGKTLCKTLSYLKGQGVFSWVGYYNEYVHLIFHYLSALQSCSHKSVADAIINRYENIWKYAL